MDRLRSFSENGVMKRLAAFLFALSVLLCDGELRSRVSSARGSVVMHLQSIGKKQRNSAYFFYENGVMKHLAAFLSAFFSSCYDDEISSRANDLIRPRQRYHADSTQKRTASTVRSKSPSQKPLAAFCRYSHAIRHAAKSLRGTPSPRRSDKADERSAILQKNRTPDYS